MRRRDELVLEFWDRSKELTLKGKKYQNFLQKFWYFLQEYDVGRSDITTNSIIAKNKKISAVITAREDGIIAGLEEFKFLNKDLKITSFKNDGDAIKNEDVFLEIKGNARKILQRERASLNLLQRMSAIATLTNLLSKNLGGRARIAATRKTLWGIIDKKAVSIGGGLTHRLNLNDGILIKDNHIKIMNFDIKKSIAAAKNKSKYIEIEVESKEQALIAAKSMMKLKNSKLKRRNLFAIMLDKIPPKEIALIIKDLKEQSLHECVLLEASGNINPNNITNYANCEADIISMGFITNSAKALNMSLEITK